MGGFIENKNGVIRGEVKGWFVRVVVWVYLGLDCVF